MDGAGWSFEIDEDESVVSVAPPGVPENLRLAVETLITPFGLRAEAAMNYLRVWRRKEREFKLGYAVGTPSAGVERISTAEVEIDDLYGQFETCTMPAIEFEAVMEVLITFLKSSRA